MTRLKFLASTPLVAGVNEAAADGESDWPRLIRTTDITGPRSLGDSIARVAPTNLRMADVAENDILLTRTGSLGTLYRHTTDTVACFAGYLVRFRADPRRADARFVEYALQSSSVREQIRLGAIRSTIDNFNATKIGNLYLPDVSPESGKRIADFFDRECERIAAAANAVAAVRPRVDERLERALDDLLYGADAGAESEWFGELPEGWQVRPLRSLAAGHPPFFTDGDWIESPYIVDEGVRLVQTGNIGRGAFVEQGFRFVTDETFTSLRCTEIKAGDVLLSRLSPPVGRACICPELGGRKIASVDVAILRSDISLIDPRWLVALCSSNR